MYHVNDSVDDIIFFLLWEKYISPITYGKLLLVSLIYLYIWKKRFFILNLPFKKLKSFFRKVLKWQSLYENIFLLIDEWIYIYITDTISFTNMWRGQSDKNMNYSRDQEHFYDLIHVLGALSDYELKAFG